MTQLPTTIAELRQLIDRANAAIAELEARPVPDEAVNAFDNAATDGYDYVDIRAGLRAAYPILKAAWERPDDGWIEWHGGECPLPRGTWHERRYRGGTVGAACDAPHTWYWGHLGGSGDIVAYRVVDKPA